MKAFGLTPHDALHGLSYANIVLMSATLPSYGGAGEPQGAIDAGDPRNADAVARAFKE